MASKTTHNSMKRMYFSPQCIVALLVCISSNISSCSAFTTNTPVLRNRHGMSSNIGSTSLFVPSYRSVPAAATTTYASKSESKEQKARQVSVYSSITQSSDENIDRRVRIKNKLTQTISSLRLTFGSASSVANKMARKAITVLLFSTVLLLSNRSVASVPSSSSASAKVHTVASSSSSSNSNSYDKMIMKYVEKHMFDDDAYDTFESTYRESYNDKQTNQNSVQNYIDSNTLFKPPQTKFNVIRLITTLPNVLISKCVAQGEQYGFDPKLVRTVMAALIVTVTPVVFLYSLLSAGGVFRKLLMKRETKQYGSIVDRSAEEKEEEIDEADEDDEDDDDDDQE